MNKLLCIFILQEDSRFITILCAIYRFTEIPEEQDVPVVDDIHEEKIYDDLCSLRSKAGSQVPI